MTTAMDIINAGRKENRRATIEMVDNGYVIDLVSSVPEFQTIRLVEKSRRKMLAVLRAFFQAKDTAEDEPETDDLEDTEEDVMAAGGQIVKGGLTDATEEELI